MQGLCVYAQYKRRIGEWTRRIVYLSVQAYCVVVLRTLCESGYTSIASSCCSQVTCHIIILCILILPNIMAGD